MAKVIKYDTDVSEKLLSGVEKTTAIVSKTMGPVASNVIISPLVPRSTKREVEREVCISQADKPAVISPPTKAETD